MIQLSLIFLGSATLKSDMNFISKDEEDVLRCKLMRVPKTSHMANIFSNLTTPQCFE